MSKRTLILEIINTLCPFVIIWAGITENWTYVLPAAIILGLIQSVGLWSYLKDYYDWR
jgi:multisubunit Na+/H+ antiporter MnhF subunit